MSIRQLNIVLLQEHDIYLFTSRIEEAFLKGKMTSRHQKQLVGLTLSSSIQSSPIWCFIHICSSALVPLEALTSRSPSYGQCASG